MRSKLDSSSFVLAKGIPVLLTAAATIVSLSACGSKSTKEETASNPATGAAAVQRSDKDILTDISMAEISKKMSPDLPREANGLAQKFAQAGKLKDAELVLSRLVSLCRMPEINDRKAMSIALNNLGLVYLKQGDFKKSEQMLQTSLVMQQQVLGPESPEFAEGINNLALLYYQQQRYSDAAPLYNRAMEILKKAPPSEKTNAVLSKTINNLATCYSHDKKFDKAQQLFNEVVALDEARLGKDNPEIAVTLNNIAYGYIMQKQYDQAESTLKRAVAIVEKSYGADSLQLVPYLQNYQSLMKKNAKLDESKKIAARVKTITETHIR